MSICKSKDATWQLQGCGKLKYKYLQRLTQRTVTSIHGDIMPGASKFELLTVIYLSQIADSSGYIEQFYTKELATVLDCSTREIYFIISNLIKKGYISASYYDNSNWSGIKNIRLLENDFSHINKYDGSSKYVSTFYSFFNFSSKVDVEHLKELSLYALRLLLHLCFMHKQGIGIRVSYETLMDTLCVSERRLIQSYLNEIKSILGTNYFVYTSRGRITYYMVIIKDNPYFVAQTSPEENQLSYYKRVWLRLIRNNAIFFDPTYSIFYYLNLIFSQIFVALKNGISLKTAENTVYNAIRQNGFYLNLIALARSSLAFDDLIASH